MENYKIYLMPFDIAQLHTDFPINIDTILMLRVTQELYLNTKETYTKAGIELHKKFSLPFVNRLRSRDVNNNPVYVVQANFIDALENHPCIADNRYNIAAIHYIKMLRYDNPVIALFSDLYSE